MAKGWRAPTESKLFSRAVIGVTAFVGQEGYHCIGSQKVCLSKSPQIFPQHNGRLTRAAWQPAGVPGYGKHAKLTSPQPGGRGKRSAPFPTLAILFRSGQNRRELKRRS